MPLLATSSVTVRASPTVMLPSCTSGMQKGAVAAFDAEAGRIGAVDEAVAVVVDAVVAELDGRVR